jgi:hypothetical protein
MAVQFTQQGYASPTGILAFPDHYVAMGYTFLQHDAAHADVNTREVIKAGTIYPTNDADAIGIVLSDIDVTDGDMTGALLIHGFVKLDALPAAPSEGVAAAFVAPTHASDTFAAGSFASGAFVAGSFTSGAFDGGATPPTHAADAFVAPTHAADAFVAPSFTPGAFVAGSFTPATLGAKDVLKGIFFMPIEIPD